MFGVIRLSSVSGNLQKLLKPVKASIMVGIERDKKLTKHGDSHEKCPRKFLSQ